MKIALNTNVLAYAEGANGAAMRDKALELIQRLPPGAIVLPVQALGEPFNVLVRKPSAGQHGRGQITTLRSGIRLY
jgi:predicted nucleic acid-binding protein